jgi:hypothetical protein
MELVVVNDSYVSSTSLYQLWKLSSVSKANKSSRAISRNVWSFNPTFRILSLLPSSWLSVYLRILHDLCNWEVLWFVWGGSWILKYCSCFIVLLCITSSQSSKVKVCYCLEQSRSTQLLWRHTYTKPFTWKGMFTFQWSSRYAGY